MRFEVYVAAGMLCFFYTAPAGYTAEVDIVINEIHYHPDTDFEQEEFIEIYNRGTEPIDISRWSLTGGIFYTFEDDTILQQNGYLVIARNTNKLSGMVNAAPIHGPFDRQLSNSGETITLRNQEGVVIDQVNYSDAPPWPSRPDGDGSSLERISPYGPSSHPKNWASAIGSSNGSWKQIQFITTLPTRRLYLQLPNRATVWIDDFQVRDTTNSSTSLVNPDFESPLEGFDTWSMRGTHSQSGRLQTDLAKSGNYVLRIQSTGAAETAITDSVSLTVNGIVVGTRNYEISFWLYQQNNTVPLIISSSNIELYNSATSNTVLMTPGSENSVYSINIPPYVDSVRTNPPCPLPGESVEVLAHIEDSDGIDRVSLIYQPVNLANQNQSMRTVPMSLLSGSLENGLWNTTLPAQNDKTLVRFFLEAVDRAGLKTTNPPKTEACWSYTYFHYSDTEFSTIPVVYLYDFGAADTEDKFPGDSTLVIRYPDREGWEVYDHINITRRQRIGEGYDVYFNNHYELEDMSSINIVFENKPRYALSEWLSYQIYQSLNVPTGKIDHYRFFHNDRPRGYFLMFEQPNKHFIQRQGLNNEGNLYKIQYSFDRSLNEQNISRQFEKRTHESAGKEDVIDAVLSMHRLTGTTQTNYMLSHLAIDSIIDYFVGCQMISDWDGYFNNHFVYHDTEGSGLWYIFPWDKDKTFGDSDAYRNILPYYDFYDMPILYGAYGTPRSGRDNGTWWRDPGYFSGPVLSNPTIQQTYLHRLGYVAKYIFTPERWIPVIDELEQRLEPEVRYKAGKVGGTLSSMLSEFQTDIESLRRQVVNRREFILTEVQKQIGPVAVDDWQLY